MEFLNEIWPFSYGHQKTLFYVPGIAILGLIALNIASAIRQKLPLQGLLSSPFSYVAKKSKTEIVISIILNACLFIGFFILLIDVLINGNQIVNMEAM